MCDEGRGVGPEVDGVRRGVYLDFADAIERLGQEVIKSRYGNLFTCIGCGACVAACPNASASLFLGAKITHVWELPQGQAERDARLVQMAAQHDAEGFGGCTNIGECAAACPKEIPLDVISQINWDLHAAMRHGR